MEESRSRIRLITEFLETKGDYPLRPDGCYISATDRTMHGLGLDNKMLDKIYNENFLLYQGRIRQETLDKIATAKEADV